MARFIEGPERPYVPNNRMGFGQIDAPIMPQLPEMPVLPDVPQAKMYSYIPRPKVEQEESLLFDYNDPTQVNSVADVLLTTFNPNMKRGNWGGLEKIPFVNWITGAIELGYKGVVKPILHGEPGTALLNTLMNAGETLDIPGNIVKGALAEGPVGIVKGTVGINGRTNYDVDTGNIVTDVMGEILLDPTNWITLGAKGAAVQTTKAATTAFVKEAAGEVAGETSEILSKKLAKRATKAYLEGDYNSLDVAIKSLAENYSKSGKLNILSKLDKTEVKTFMDNVYKSSMECTSQNILDATRKLVNPVESYESWMLKQVANSTGIRPAWLFIKYFRESNDFVGESLLNQFAKTMEPYATEDKNINILRYAEVEAEVDNWVKKVNTARKMNGSNLITQDITVHLIRSSLEANYIKLEDLFLKYAKDPDTLNKELKAYYKMPANVKDATAYMYRTLKEINTKYNGKFDDFVNIVKEQLDHQRHMKDYAVAQQTLTHCNFYNDTINTIDRLHSDGYIATLPKLSDEAKAVIDNKTIEALKDSINRNRYDRRMKLLDVDIAKATHAKEFKRAEELQNKKNALKQKYKADVEVFREVLTHTRAKEDMGRIYRMFNETYDVYVQKFNELSSVFKTHIAEQSVSRVSKGQVMFDLKTTNPDTFYKAFISGDKFELNSIKRLPGVFKTNVDETALKKLKDSIIKKGIANGLDKTNPELFDKLKTIVHAMEYDESVVINYTKKSIPKINTDLQNIEMLYEDFLSNSSFDFGAVAALPAVFKEQYIITNNNILAEVKNLMYKNGVEKGINITDMAFLNVIEHVVKTIKFNEAIVTNYLDTTFAKNIADFLDNLNTYSEFPKLELPTNLKRLDADLLDKAIKSYTEQIQTVKATMLLERPTMSKFDAEALVGESNYKLSAKILDVATTLTKRRTQELNLYNSNVQSCVNKVLMKYEELADLSASKTFLESMEELARLVPNIKSMDFRAYELIEYFDNLVRIVNSSEDVNDIRYLLSLDSYQHEKILSTVDRIMSEIETKNHITETVLYRINPDYNLALKEEYYHDLQGFTTQQLSPLYELVEVADEELAKVTQLDVARVFKEVSVKLAKDSNPYAQYVLQHLAKVSVNTAPDKLAKALDEVFFNDNLKYLEDSPLMPLFVRKQFDETVALKNKIVADIKNNVDKLEDKLRDFLRNITETRNPYSRFVAEQLSSISIKDTAEISNVLEQLFKSEEYLYQKLTSNFREHNSSNIKEAAWGDGSKDAAKVEQSYKLLKELKGALETISPIKAKKFELQLNSGAVIYATKQESAYVSMQLASEETLVALTNDIVAGQGVGTIINQLANLSVVGSDVAKAQLLVTSAKNLVQSAKEHKNYLTLLSRVQNHTEIKKVTVSAFISTLQKFISISPSAFLERKHMYLNRIFDSMESYIYASNMVDSLSLDQFSKANPEIVDKVLNRLNKTGVENVGQHDALFDIYLLEELINEKGLFKDHPNKLVLFDIETSDLNANQGRTFQIAVKEYGADNGINLKKKVSANGADLEIPSAGFLSKRYSDTPEATYAENVKRFLAEYGESGYATEAELYTNFIHTLRGYGPNIHLVAHNGKEFDFSFITDRMSELGMSEDLIYEFKRYIKQDTKQLLEEANGKIKLRYQERSAIANIMTAYATAQDNINAERFIAFGGDGIRETLRNLKYTIEAIFGNGGSKTFNGITINSVHEQKLLDTLTLVEHSLGGILNQVKQSNRNMSKDALIFMEDLKAVENNEYYKAIQTHLEEEAFNIVAADYHKDAQGFYKIANNNKIYVPEEFIHEAAESLKQEFGTYMNTTKMFTYGTDSKFSNFGVKRIGDDDLVLNWFKFKHGQTLSKDELIKFTKDAKIIQRNRDLIKRVDIITDNAKVIEDAYAQLRRRFAGVVAGQPRAFNVMSHVIYKYLGYVATDKVDPLSQFAILQYAYYKLHNENVLEAMQTSEALKQIVNRFDEIFTPELEQLITTDVLKKKTEYLPAEQVYVNKIAEDVIQLSIDTEVANPLAVKKLAEEMKELVEETKSLTPIGYLYDEHSIHRGLTQALSTSLNKASDMLEYAKNAYLKGTPEQQKALYDYSSNSLKEMCLTQTVQFLRSDANRLFSSLVHNGFLTTFKVNDIKTMGLIKEFDEFTKVVESLKNKGVAMTEVNGRIYITLKPTKEIKVGMEDGNIYYLHGSEKVERPVWDEIATTLDTPDQQFTTHLDNTRSMIHELSNGASIGSVGDTINKYMYEYMYNGIPEEIKKLLPPIDFIVDDKFFQVPRYNFTNIGSYYSRKHFQNYLPKTLEHLYKGTSEVAALRGKSRIKYMQYYFGKEFSINNGPLSELSDDVLLEAIGNSKEFIVSALITDEKWGCKAVELRVTNAKELAEARRLDAVIMPTQTYSKVVESINHNIMGETRLKWLNRVIQTFKLGYLVPPAVWGRNYVDGTLKNMIMTRSIIQPLIKQKQAAAYLKKFESVSNKILNLSMYDLHYLVNEAKLSPEILDLSLNLEIAENRIIAMQMLSKYTDISQKIVKMDIDRTFTKENLDFFFKHMAPEMTREEFEMIDTFLKDGASAGYTKTFKNYFENKQFKPEITRKGQGLDDAYGHVMKTLNWMMAPNTYIEQINRLTEYLILLEKGDSTSKAFYQVARTHFDYNLKTEAQRLTELIFPFYTFSMKNLEFWLDAVAENPMLANWFRDTTAPIFDFDETDHYELDHNLSLQYQILAGNIPLTDSGLTLKLNPSFMDTYKMLLDPVGSAHDKMFAPLQTITDIAMSNNEGYNKFMGVYGGAKVSDLFNTSLIPVFGANYQRMTETASKYYERTGNPLNLAAPGMFGATKRFKPYEPKPKVVKNRGQYQYGARAKKVYHKNVYHKDSNTPKAYRPFGMGDKPYEHKYASYVYPNSRESVGFYKKHYGPSGKSKMRTRMMPVTSGTLKFRIKDMQGRYWR